jgi:hypothetical protein
VVGVEGDYAVLDYGAGVCAVCVDYFEVEMSWLFCNRKNLLAFPIGVA